MNHFVKKTILFALIPMLFLIGVFIGFNFLVKTDHKLKSDISIVFIGDSHIQHAFNDSLIPNSKNFGSSSESFYFSYFKLKSILKHNPNVKHVYLGLGFHNLSNYYDDFIHGVYAPFTAPKYYFTLESMEQIKLLYRNSSNFHPLVKGVIKTAVFQVLELEKYPYLGGYSNEFGATSAVGSSMNKRLDFQFYKKDELNSFSDLNLRYLYKIQKLCANEGVTLSVVNTPLHPYYFKQIPVEYKMKLKEIIESKHLDYIDLSQLKLADAHYIPDGDHVSALGAQLTTQKLNELMQARKPINKNHR